MQANSYFAEMLLDLAKRKPHLIFKTNTPHVLLLDHLDDDLLLEDSNAVSGLSTSPVPELLSE
ncbi:hypothetical protein B0H17DRAFT_1196967 [Mycena rosella]|uniref:Uncharacterized protein n=1 Tax=Mycena rosella TaxID=1033263 RepID=A0AAD7DSJ0_MYCRO|nr:hypothetical protein B0H17DRAFT_1196967 [Mycena rosella]